MVGSIDPGACLSRGARTSAHPKASATPIRDRGWWCAHSARRTSSYPDTVIVVFVSIRSQATTISRKVDVQCTEAEVLLVTLLLYDRIDEGFDFDGWAATVVAESAAFVPGAPWSATGKPLATAQEKLESRLPGLNPARVALVGTAATLYDGAGRAAAVYTRDQMNNYLRSLLAPPRSATVWLGVSHAGSSLTRGATLRRTYIMPLVARLWRDEAARIRRACEAAENALCETLPVKTPASATKVCFASRRRDAAHARRGRRTRDVTPRARSRRVASCERARLHMKARNTIVASLSGSARARRRRRPSSGVSRPPRARARARRAALGSSRSS